MHRLPQTRRITAPPPFDVLTPEFVTSPVVFASPHSGSFYPKDFLNLSRLDPHNLRKSEDSFVDELFNGAPLKGATLIRANYPRAYLDVNREAWELDPHMFHDTLPEYVNKRSSRVNSGLGTIARIVSVGAEIYKEKLKFSDALDRINKLYFPYHKELARLLEITRNRFGFAVLVDCHSMPSIGGPMDQDRGRARAEIVLGDRYGTSCSPILTDTVEQALTSMGYKVRRNSPYAGGYVTKNYGCPDQGVHTLQIEINRALYMNEEQINQLPTMPLVQSQMTKLIEILCEVKFDQTT